MVNFHLKVAWNWDLSFSNLRKFLLHQRSWTLATFSDSKRTNLNFRLLLGGNWPKYMKTTPNLIKVDTLEKFSFSKIPTFSPLGLIWPQFSWERLNQKFQKLSEIIPYILVVYMSHIFSIESKVSPNVSFRQGWTKLHF